MKKCFLPFLVIGMSLLNLSAFSQTEKDTTALLGLPGDNLDIYAVLSLFQKSGVTDARHPTTCEVAQSAAGL